MVYKCLIHDAICKDRITSGKLHEHFLLLISMKKVFILMSVFARVLINSQEDLQSKANKLQYISLPVSMSIIVMCYVILLWVMVQSIIHTVNIIMVIVDDVVYCVSGNKCNVTSLFKYCTTL
jgi:hypothetical protein